MYNRFYRSRYSKCKMAWILAIAIASIAWTWASTSLAAETEQQGKEPAKVFRAGAYAIDITPLELPVLVNGIAV